MIKFVSFHGRAWDDYLYWHVSNKQLTSKLNKLFEDCVRHPFTGIGKTELLKNEYTGCWSRRIDEEHRLVYQVIGEQLYILQCRYHYTK